MPKMKQLQSGPFEGFQGPNYTQVPDQLFDELLPELSGAELKALLYIMRKTFGWKKESDNISISQMLEGITAKDGHVVDRGVGLTKKTLLKALSSLEEKGVILRTRRRSESRGNEPTSYRLNVRGKTLGGKSTLPLGEKVRQGGGGEITPSPWGKKYATQETINIQDTVLQETDIQQQDNDVVVILKEYGIPDKTAQEISENHSSEYIHEKIDYFIWLMANDKRRIERNPVGFLISAIKNDYKPDMPGDDQALWKAVAATEKVKEQRDYSKTREDLPTGST